MQAAGAGVGHVGLDGSHLQVPHKGFGSLTSALDAEADHAAGAVGQVLLRPEHGMRSPGRPQ